MRLDESCFTKANSPRRVHALLILATVAALLCGCSRTQPNAQTQNGGSAQQPPMYEKPLTPSVENGPSTDLSQDQVESSSPVISTLRGEDYAAERRLDKPIDPDIQRILSNWDQENIPRILPYLTHENPAVRLEAIYNLGAIYTDGLGNQMAGPIAERLADSDPRIRRSAASTLGDMKTEAAPVLDALIAALNDEDRKTYEYTTYAISVCGETAAEGVPALIKQLKTDNYDRQKYAAEALGMIGEPAKVAVADLLKMTGEGYPGSVKVALGRLGQADVLTKIALSVDAYQREEAARGLGYVSPTNAAVVAELARLVEDDDDNVRYAAAESLGRAHPTSEAAIAAIKLAASDEVSLVRQRAIVAIQYLDPKLDSAIDILLHALEDKSVDVRQAAAIGIGYYHANDRARIIGLLIAANDEDTFVRSLALPILTEVLKDHERSETLRGNAAFSLGMIRETDEKAVSSLLTALLTSPDEPVAVRVYAAGFLMWMGSTGFSEQQYDALYEGLQNGPDADVKSFSAQHLGQLKDPRAVPLLIESLQSTEADVALFSAGSLGLIGRDAKDAVPILCQMLADPQCKIRSSVADALGGIRLGGAISLPALLKALTDNNGDVRMEAAGSIGMVAREDGADVERAVKALAESLSDDEIRVARRAAESLTRLGPQAGEAVLQLTRALGANSDAVRREAATALGAIGNAAAPAISALIVAADDENEGVRREAVTALSDLMLDAERVVPVLASKLSDPAVTTWALTGLQQFGTASQPAVPQVIQALQSAEKYYNRAGAAEALVAIGDNSESVINALTEASQHDADESVRNAAADALKELTGGTQSK